MQRLHCFAKSLWFHEYTCSNDTEGIFWKNKQMYLHRHTADEVRNVDGGQGVTADEVVNNTNTTDCTWQRSGYSSRNGVVTIIGNSTGKCIDYRVMTKDCKACKYWKDKDGTRADNFLIIHKCPLDHTKSSGQWNLMEF